MEKATQTTFYSRYLGWRENSLQESVYVDRGQSHETSRLFILLEFLALTLNCVKLD